MKTNKTVKFIFACVLTLSLVLSSFVFAPLSATAATTAVNNWQTISATPDAGIDLANKGNYITAMTVGAGTTGGFMQVATPYGNCSDYIAPSWHAGTQNTGNETRLTFKLVSSAASTVFIHFGAGTNPTNIYDNGVTFKITGANGDTPHMYLINATEPANPYDCGAIVKGNEYALQLLLPADNVNNYQAYATYRAYVNGTSVKAWGSFGTPIYAPKWSIGTESGTANIVISSAPTKTAPAVTALTNNAQALLDSGRWESTSDEYKTLSAAKAAVTGYLCADEINTLSNTITNLLTVGNWVPISASGIAANAMTDLGYHSINLNVGAGTTGGVIQKATPYGACDDYITPSWNAGTGNFGNESRLTFKLVSSAASTVFIHFGIGTNPTFIYDNGVTFKITGANGDTPHLYAVNAVAPDTPIDCGAITKGTEYTLKLLLPVESANGHVPYTTYNAYVNDVKKVTNGSFGTAIYAPKWSVGTETGTANLVINSAPVKTASEISSLRTTANSLLQTSTDIVPQNSEVRTNLTNAYSATDGILFGKSAADNLTDAIAAFNKYIDDNSIYWHGNIAAGLENGSGTKTDPYKISTASELAYVAKNLGTTRGKYYELTNDIAISNTSLANWTQAASEWPSKITTPGNAFESYKGELGFAGVLNGNGYTISGIYVNGGLGAGLFTVINGGAVIYNLNIDNSSITSNMAGAFGGYAKTHTYAWNAGANAFTSSGNLGNIRIANCTVRDGVTINGINGAGGFIGCVTNTFDANSPDNNIIFGNCGSFAAVTATAAGRANGFIGENYQGGFFVNNSFCFGNAARSGLAPVSVNLMINQNANTIKDAAALNTLWKLDFVNTWKATAGGYPVLTTAIKHNGDVSLDGVVDATDLSELVAHILGTKDVINTNVNNDNVTDILDLVALKKLIAGVNSLSNSTVTLNGKTYSYAWGSEFDGNSLDTSKFAYTSDMNGSGNLSLVQDSLDYADVKDGNLVLTAKKDGSVYKSAGCIGTPSKMHYKYGYVEIRAKVPFGTATFPAFWAKSVNMGKGYLEDNEYGVEIDIFEQHVSTNGVASNVHKWVKDGASMTSTHLGGNKPTTTVSTTNDYHTYGFEWYEGAMKFYVDGTCIGSYDYSTGTNPNIQDFDGQIYLILDNMIETAYAGDGFNNTFEIDYIRLYQNADDNGSLTLF